MLNIEYEISNYISISIISKPTYDIGIPLMLDNLGPFFITIVRGPWF